MRAKLHNYPWSPSIANVHFAALVMVVIRTPGIDGVRVRQAEDRNYLVLTLDQERIIRMRACRNRDEARSFAGIT